MIYPTWKNGIKVFIPICDYCSDELPLEYDFYDAVDAKKAAGWHSVNQHGEWQDYCEKCAHKITGAAADFGGVGNG